MSPEDRARTADSISLADVPVAAAIVDRVGFVVAANGDFESLTGHTTGAPIGDVVADGVRQRLGDLILDDGLRRSAVFPLAEAERGPTLAEFRVSHTTTSGDAVVFVLPRDPALDLVDRVAATTIGHDDVGVIVEHGGRFVHVGRSAGHALGRSVGDIIEAGSLDELLVVGEGARIDELVTRRHDDDPDAPVVTESLVEGSDGRLLAVDLSISSDGDGLRIILVADAARRDERESRRARSAVRDDLTGLPNRHLLLDRLSGALSRMRRRPAEAVLCVLDLDGFGSVNDELGPVAGDEVLRIVAGRLVARLRPSDTVARLSGDEFAVLFDTTPGDGTPGELADRLRSMVAEPIIGPDWVVEVVASVGTIVVDDPRTDPDHLLDDAVRAMYADKPTPS